MRVRSDFKKCSCCKRWLDQNEFYKMGILRLQPRCKKCSNACTKKSRKKNPEKYKKLKKRWREQNPEKVRNQYKRGKRKNSKTYEKMKKRERAWYYKNKDKARDIRNSWVEKNYEKFVAQQQVYRAVKCGYLKPQKSRKCCCLDNSCLGDIEYHHVDYQLSLIVVPLCKSHNRRLHNHYRAIKKNQLPVKGDEQIAQIVQEEFLFLCEGEKRYAG